MSEKKKVQKMRYSDEELSIIKNTFADNDDIVKAIRKAFLQMPVDVIDKQILDNIKVNTELQKVIRKTFLPTLEPNAPLHQLIDLWMTVEVKDKPLETANINILARQLLIDLLDQQLKFIEKGTAPKILISSLIGTGAIGSYEPIVNLSARNTLVSHVEMMLNSLTIMAGQKEETVQQTKDRLAKDSAK